MILILLALYFGSWFGGAPEYGVQNNFVDRHLNDFLLLGIAELLVEVLTTLYLVKRRRPRSTPLGAIRSEEFRIGNRTVRTSRSRRRAAR